MSCSANSSTHSIALALTEPTYYSDFSGLSDPKVDAMTEATFDMQEQIARIARAQEETRKFIEEQHKLAAEAKKLSRERELAPWQVAFAGMAAGAALVGATVGATAAFYKLMG